MSPQQRRLLPYLSLFLVWIVWGSTYLFIRVAVREVPPFAAASLRFVASGLVMAVVAFVVDRRDGRPSLRQVADYALIGVLLLGVGNAFLMWAEKRIPSGIAALIVAAVPLWITLCEGLRKGGEPWTTRTWAGTLIGLAGVALVARPTGGLGGEHWKAVLLLQVGTLAWTFGSLYSQSVSRRPSGSLPLASAAAIEMLAASAVLGLESWFFGESWSEVAAASPTAWGALAYLTVFGSLVGFTAYAYCLNELPASIVGSYAYVNPVVAVTLGALFLKEPLSAAVLAGGALIVAAVVITTTRKKKAAARRPAAAAPAAEPGGQPALAQR